MRLIKQNIFLQKCGRVLKESGLESAKYTVYPVTRFLRLLVQRETLDPGTGHVGDSHEVIVTHVSLWKTMFTCQSLRNLTTQLTSSPRTNILKKKLNVLRMKVKLERFINIQNQNITKGRGPRTIRIYFQYYSAVNSR